jgi:hypothetical protein
MADLLRALEKKYEGDIAVHTANIQVYQENPSGIGEHPEIVQALDAEVSKLTDAIDKLKAIKGLLHPSVKTLVE